MCTYTSTCSDCKGHQKLGRRNTQAKSGLRNHHNLHNIARFSKDGFRRNFRKTPTDLIDVRSCQRIYSQIMADVLSKFLSCLVLSRLLWFSDEELWRLGEANKEGEHDQMTDRVNSSIDKHWRRCATLFAQKPDGESCWNLIRAEIMFRATRDTSFLSAWAGGWCGLWLSWHSSPITDSQRNPSAKTLNAPIHLSDMRAEMCSAFNSSINQLLSSTDEWDFGCHEQTMAKKTNNKWFPREMYFNEITACFCIKTECLIEHCLVSLFHALL